MNQKLLALLAITLSAVVLSVVLLNSTTSLRTKHRQQAGAAANASSVNNLYQQYLSSNAHLYGLDFEEYAERQAASQRQQQRQQQHQQLYQEYLSSNASRYVQFEDYVEHRENSQRQQRRQQLYQAYLNSTAPLSGVDFEEYEEYLAYNASLAAAANLSQQSPLQHHLGQFHLSEAEEFDLDSYLLNQHFNRQQAAGNQSAPAFPHYPHYDQEDLADQLRYQYFQQNLQLNGQNPISYVDFEDLEDGLLYHYLQQQQQAAAANSSNSSAQVNAIARGSTSSAKRGH
jgi:hypothetical protein